MSLGYQYTFNPTAAIVAAASVGSISIFGEPASATATALESVITADAVGAISVSGEPAMADAVAQEAIVTTVRIVSVSGETAASSAAVIGAIVTTAGSVTISPATKLGLYGAPTAASPLIVTATASGTFAINIEVADEIAVSTTFQTNLEVNGETVVSGTQSVNIEVIDTSVPGSPTTEGGTPDSTLNLPTYAKASRLRADFYQWNVNIVPGAKSVEFIGPKVGSAPLASIAQFDYTGELDAVGEWSILIPANDERASVIIDGTAEIMKLYYEDVGHIFTGIIDDYEIVDQETMRVVGRDMMFRMAENNVLWRLDTETINFPATTKTWRDYYNYVMGTFLWGFGWGFHSSMPNDVIYQGNEDGDFLGIVPKYSSQSVLDVLRDFNASSGAHFRVYPAGTPVIFGSFGEDSGIIIAPAQEDDPTVREDGSALILRSFSYLKTKEELVNMIVVQGSNDSFGIAVELRHSNRVTSYDVPYLVATPSEGSSVAGITSGGSVGFIRGISPNGDLYPIDLIPTDYIQERYDNYLNAGPSVPTVSAGGHILSATGGSGTVAAGGPYASIGYPEDRLACAIKFTVTENFYPTFASFINVGGIGAYLMAITPSSGGVPDFSSPNIFKYSNYFQNRLPGNYIRSGISTSSSSGFSALVYNPPSTYIPEEDREYGVLTEIIGFIDYGEAGAGGLPWPLLTPGDYFLVIWGTASPAVDIPGIGPVHYGHHRDKIHLLKYNDTSSSNRALFMDYSGSWEQSSFIVVAGSVYGRAASSSYPYAVEGMLAEAVQDNGSGHRVFFMRDLDSIKTHGLRQAAVSFPNALDSSEGVRDIIPMSDLLHDQAQVYLTNRSEPFEKLTVTCTGLFRLPLVGQKVRFVYRGMALNENGEYKWLDINSDWYVLSINWSIREEGLEHTLTLTNVPDDIVNPRNIAADFARNLERSKNNLGELHIASRRVGDGVQATT